MPLTKLAFGDNEVDGKACPANAAGIDPLSNPVLEVAEAYDSEMLKLIGVDEGTADVDTVIEGWENAIERAQVENDYPQKSVTQGKRVLNFLKENQ